MDVSEAVATRRSVRAFLGTPVERAVLETVLDKARRAPSGGNVQPWHAVVATGTVLRGVIDAVAADAAAKRSSPEYDIYPPGLPEPYRARRSGCGEEMYAALGLAREDRPGRMAHVMRNFLAFDAPVVLFCHTPDFMGKPQWSDLGMWLQTVMLLLREAGLHSCPQEAWSSYAAPIKRVLGVPDGHVLFCGIAIGHPDPGAAVNRASISRASMQETVRFEGF